MKRKKIIDIITENNFKEISSTPANMYSIMFDAEGKDKVICRANCKIFTYVDDEYVLLDTSVTLKAYYYEKYEDINNEIQIHRANRLIFEGKVETEEEFEILLRMLSL
jgi:hypothetical protein